jgi:hypothetical protein
MNKWYIRDAITDRLISEAPDLPSAIMAADCAIEEEEAEHVAIYLQVLTASAHTGLNGARKALYRRPDDEAVDDMTDTGPGADLRRAQST